LLKPAVEEDIRGDEFRPRRSPVRRAASVSGDAWLKKPITGIAASCARAASDPRPARLTPQTSVMNSRRLTRPPHELAGVRISHPTEFCVAMCARSLGPKGVNGGIGLVSVAKAKEPLADCPMGETCQRETFQAAICNHHVTPRNFDARRTIDRLSESSVAEIRCAA
jgi:hypothetical protein